jgi:hypothetical protein
VFRPPELQSVSVSLRTMPGWVPSLCHGGREIFKRASIRLYPRVGKDGLAQGTRRWAPRFYRRVHEADAPYFVGRTC